MTIYLTVYMCLRTLLCEWPEGSLKSGMTHVCRVHDMFSAEPNSYTLPRFQALGIWKMREREKETSGRGYLQCMLSLSVIHNSVALLLWKQLLRLGTLRLSRDCWKQGQMLTIRTRWVYCVQHKLSRKYDRYECKVHFHVAIYYNSCYLWPLY